jgi:hypothetical protein
MIKGDRALGMIDRLTKLKALSSLNVLESRRGDGAYLKSLSAIPTMPALRAQRLASAGNRLLVKLEHRARLPAAPHDLQAIGPGESQFALRAHVRSPSEHGC